MAKSIIEKEIERRERLIDENEEKIKIAAELKKRAEELEMEFAAFDESAVRAEIEELETYLPKPEPAPETNDTSESPEIVYE